MATTFIHTASGLADGTVITSVNSGTAPDTAYPNTQGISTTPTGVSFTASTVSVSDGYASCEKFTFNGSNGRMYVEDGPVSIPLAAFDIYSEIVDFTVLPPISSFIHTWSDSTSSTIASLNLMSDGTISITLAAGSTYNTTARVSSGDRIVVMISVGSTSGAGTVSVAINSGNTIATRAGGISVIGSAPMGIKPIVSSKRGVSPGIACSFRFAAVQHIVGATSATDPGPLGFAPPSISTSTTVVNSPYPNTTASVSFTGTSVTGTITSMSSTISSSSGVTIPTIGSPSYVGLNTTSCTATFLISGLNAGIFKIAGIAIDSISQSSAIPAVAQVNSTSITPTYQAASLSSYSIAGNSTSALAALNKNSPSTDYLQSPQPPSGTSETITFNPLDPNNIPVSFGVSGRASDANKVITRTVILMQGSIIVATRSAALTINNSTIGGTTNSGETASITDRSALYVKYSDTY